MGALFCHPDRSRILSGEAEGSTRSDFSSPRFRQIAPRSTSERAWQPVQIGFSQPRTSCPQSLRVDSSASLGMTQQINASQRINPHRPNVETRVLPLWGRLQRGKAGCGGLFRSLLVNQRGIAAQARMSRVSESKTEKDAHLTRPHHAEPAAGPSWD